MLGRRLWAVLAIAGIASIAVWLAACGGSEDSESPSGDSAKIERGGTLISALSANPRNFDPMVQNDSHSGEITAQIVEGLYNYNEKYEPVPWLAEKIDISADGLTYTFNLRQGVKFHDATEMDAEAVKFSMDRVRANPRSPGYRDGQEIVETTVVSKYVFKFQLKEPFSSFPSKLTGRLGGVVSPTAVKSMGDEKFALAPVGTGPFKFDEWRQDNFVRVKKFDGYWRTGADGQPLPYLDGVEWRIITESASRTTALQAGDLHIVPSTAAGIRDADIPVLKKDSNIVIEQTPGRSFSGIFMTINKPPFDNKALRQAVAYAVDRDEVVKAIYEGNRVVANGPIPPPLTYAVEAGYKPFTTDLTKAKAKLAEGGQPNGFEFEYWIAAGDSIGQQLAELLQAQLAKAGIRMKIEAGDFNGVVVPKLTGQQSNAYQISLTGGVDAEQFVASAFQDGGGFNVFPYKNDRVEELIKQTRRTTNLEERGKAFKEAARIIVDDVPLVFITHGIDRHVGQKKVQGWYVGLKDTSGYSEYWLDQ